MKITSVLSYPNCLVRQIYHCWKTAKSVHWQNVQCSQIDRSYKRLFPFLIWKFAYKWSICITISQWLSSKSFYFDLNKLAHPNDNYMRTDTVILYFIVRDKTEHCIDNPDLPTWWCLKTTTRDIINVSPGELNLSHLFFIFPFFPFIIVNNTRLAVALPKTWCSHLIPEWQT